MGFEARDLNRPVPEGASILAGDLLRLGQREARRLQKGRDPAALHDFRVALRRLRSLLRALRPWLAPPLRRRQERRLRTIARSTASARDNEVQLAWLARERLGARPRELPGIAWLEDRLEAAHREGRSQAAQDAARRFRRLARRMARDLAQVSGADYSKVAGGSLGAALAGLVDGQALELSATLDRISDPFQVEECHAARIAAKRLRYLLLPLRGELAEAHAAETLLRELQEILGELHDAHVALDLLLEALAESAMGRAGQAHAAVLEGDQGTRAVRLLAHIPTLRGLLLLDRRAVERARTAYDSLAREWFPRHRATLVQALASVTSALASHPAADPPQARRFLLARVPGALGSAAQLRVETGWLEGPSPRSWIRSVAGPAGSRWLRGGEANPNPEEISEGTFLGLWPATEGRRLRADRHLLVSRGQAWVVDSLPGLHLAIAEVVAPAGDLRFPRVLRQVVVREITDEKAYREVALAARQGRALSAQVPGEVPCAKPEGLAVPETPAANPDAEQEPGGVRSEAMEPGGAGTSTPILVDGAAEW